MQVEAKKSLILIWQASVFPAAAAAAAPALTRVIITPLMYAACIQLLSTFKNAVIRCRPNRRICLQRRDQPTDPAWFILFLRCENVITLPDERSFSSELHEGAVEDSCWGEKFAPLNIDASYATAVVKGRHLLFLALHISIKRLEGHAGPVLNNYQTLQIALCNTEWSVRVSDVLILGAQPCRESWASHRQGHCIELPNGFMCDIKSGAAMWPFWGTPARHSPRFLPLWGKKELHSSKHNPFLPTSNELKGSSIFPPADIDAYLFKRAPAGGRCG